MFLASPGRFLGPTAGRFTDVGVLNREADSLQVILIGSQVLDLPLHGSL